MFARIALALPLGVLVTGGLLYMMDLFIATGHGQSETQAFRVVDFVRVERSEAVEKREQRPDKPETLEPAPDLDMPDMSDQFNGSLNVSVATDVAVDFGTQIGRAATSISDGEYLPIVKVAPVYPVRALQRRLEGYVVVEFVVTSSGAVRDIAIVESSDPLFEQAAIEAASKFKYRPRVVDGIAVEVSGVQNRITFRLSA